MDVGDIDIELWLNREYKNLGVYSSPSECQIGVLAWLLNQILL